MAGATHLQNRLDKADVQHILSLREQGLPTGTIALRYKLSSASISRILSGAWNQKQIAAWGLPTHQTRVRTSMRHYDDDNCGCPLCVKERENEANPEKGHTLMPKARQLSPEQRKYKGESDLLLLIQDRKELEEMLVDNAQQISKMLGLPS